MAEELYFVIKPSEELSPVCPTFESAQSVEPGIGPPTPASVPKKPPTYIPVESASTAFGTKKQFVKAPNVEPVFRASVMYSTHSHAPIALNLPTNPNGTPTSAVSRIVEPAELTKLIFSDMLHQRLLIHRQMLLMHH